MSGPNGRGKVDGGWWMVDGGSDSIKPRDDEWVEVGRKIEGSVPITRIK